MNTVADITSTPGTEPTIPPGTERLKAPIRLGFFNSRIPQKTLCRNESDFRIWQQNYGKPSGSTSFQNFNSQMHKVCFWHSRDPLGLRR